MDEGSFQVGSQLTNHAKNGFFQDKDKTSNFLPNMVEPATSESIFSLQFCTVPLGGWLMPNSLRCLAVNSADGKL